MPLPLFKGVVCLYPFIIPVPYSLFNIESPQGKEQGEGPYMLALFDTGFFVWGGGSPCIKPWSLVSIY